MQASQDIVPTKQLLSNGVVGMILFVACEVMFFLALISAYMIVSAGQVVWPPVDQPRLPVELTAFNTVVLLLSGFLIFLSNKNFQNNKKEKAVSLMLKALICATFFVLVQGWEWFHLIVEGLTLFSSNYGSFFYLLVGTHALHALFAIGIMFYVYLKMRKGTASESAFQTSQVFWYFVVGIWPVLYITVYLN